MRGRRPSCAGASRGIDDIAGVLDGTDPSLLGERAEPGLAADAGDPHGHVIDLLIDLGAGHLLLRGQEPLRDQLASHQRLEDLLTLAGDALVGQLLARDHLAIDGGDRVGRIDRDRRLLQSRSVFLDRRPTEAAAAPLSVSAPSGGPGGLVFPQGLRRRAGWLHAQGPDGRQGDQDHPVNLTTALHCDHREASPLAKPGQVRPTSIGRSGDFGFLQVPERSGRDSRPSSRFGQSQLWVRSRPWRTGMWGSFRPRPATNERDRWIR